MKTFLILQLQLGPAPLTICPLAFANQPLSFSIHDFLFAFEYFQWSLWTLQGKHGRAGRVQGEREQ